MFEPELVHPTEVLAEARDLLLALKLEAGGVEQQSPVTDMPRLGRRVDLVGGEDISAGRTEQPADLAQRGDPVLGEEDRVEAERGIGRVVREAGCREVANDVAGASVGRG